MSQIVRLIFLEFGMKTYEWIAGTMEVEELPDVNDYWNVKIDVQGKTVKDGQFKVTAVMREYTDVPHSFYSVYLTPKT